MDFAGRLQAGRGVDWRALLREVVKPWGVKKQEGRGGEGRGGVGGGWLDCGFNIAYDRISQLIIFWAKGLSLFHAFYRFPFITLVRGGIAKKTRSKEGRPNKLCWEVLSGLAGQLQMRSNQILQPSGNEWISIEILFIKKKAVSSLYYKWFAQ